MTSVVSTYASVKPHATRPLLPTVMKGVAGSVTPTRRGGPASAVHGHTAAYQIWGRAWSRCMSFATRAAPVAVCAPARAKELEPVTFLSGKVTAAWPAVGADCAWKRSGGSG